jgi:hypothetical protein
MRKSLVFLAIATATGAACAQPVRVAPIEKPGPGMVASGNTLEVEFPAVPIDRIGCPADSGRRLYYWMASAWYPGSVYPNNHFQQVLAWFKLPAGIAVGTSQFDSALARQAVKVVEAGGEPAMTLRELSADRARVVLEPLAGTDSVRARMFVEGKAATRSFVAVRVDSVFLGWCDASHPYRAVTVPLRRRGARGQAAASRR